MTSPNRKNNKATAIRKLTRMGLSVREITAKLNCSPNYVYLVKAAMKPKKAKPVPPYAELGLASLDPAMNAQKNAYEGQRVSKPKASRPTAEERRAAALEAYNISQGRIEQMDAEYEARIDKRHQVIEKYMTRVIYIVLAAGCGTLAYLLR